MAKKASTAVATRKTTEVASNVPSFMAAKAGRGTHQIDTADMEMPRVRLIQGTDQELISTHDGLAVGHFFHTLAEVDLGEELRIVPVHISKRVVLWRPRPPIDEGGIIARAEDCVHWSPPSGEVTVFLDKAKKSKATYKWNGTVEESGLLEWGSSDPDDKDSPPAATLCHVIVVMLPDFPQYSPVALYLQRTAIKPARKLLGKINIIGAQAPAYGQIYSMAATLEGDTGQQYQNYTFTAAGFVDDQAEFERYEKMFENFDRTGVKIRDEDKAQETGGEGGRGGATAPKYQKTGKSKY